MKSIESEVDSGAKFWTAHSDGESRRIYCGYQANETPRNNGSLAFPSLQNDGVARARARWPER